MTVSVAIFSIAEALPVVGRACGICKKLLLAAKDVNDKIKDVQQVVQTTWNVAKFLNALPDVLQHLNDQRRVEDIEAEIGAITKVIREVCEEVGKFNQAGYLKAMLYATR